MVISNRLSNLSIMAVYIDIKLLNSEPGEPRERSDLRNSAAKKREKLMFE